MTKASLRVFTYCDSAHNSKKNQPYTCMGMGKVYSDCKEEWGPGKLNWLRRFLTEHDQYYAVDSFFTDFFGYNGTANWNGYIRRMY